MSDPIFSKTLPVFCPPLPTEPLIANKQEAPCTQLRARECGEGVVYRPPQQHNSHIPSPPPRCVSRKIKSVCKLCKSGAMGWVPGTATTTGVEAMAMLLLPLASAAVAQQQLTLHQSQTSKGWIAPQPEQRQWDWSPPALSWKLESDQCAKARHCEKFVPQENLLRTAFQTWSFITSFMPKSVLYNHERERERDKDREREREREKNLSRRKGRAN